MRKATKGHGMDFRFLDATNLFPIPLYRFRIDDPALDKALLGEIAVRRKSEEGQQNVNRLGWQSASDLFDRTEEGHRSLNRRIIQILREVVRSEDPSVDFERLRLHLNGWVNVNPPGGFNSPHQHSEAHWSGVYYVDVPQSPSGNGGSIEFLSPHPVRLTGGLIKAPSARDRVRIAPEAGDMLIFPGSLPHWVLPNDSKKARTTIAFNAVLAAKR